MEAIGMRYGVSQAAVSLDGSWRRCRLAPSPPLAEKAAEKAPRTAEGLCQMTEPLKILIFSGLQTASACPNK